MGICAVLVQGVLYRWVQPRIGERQLASAGLVLMILGLSGTALAAQAWLLVPMIGLVALGSGLSIPSLTGLLSNQVGESAQGRLMGGIQALLSLASIVGPALAGLSFERIGVSAPYALGALLVVLALVLAQAGLRQNQPINPGR